MMTGDDAIVAETKQRLGADIPTPPDNIGPRSTPNYAALAAAAVTTPAERRQGVCGAT